MSEVSRSVAVISSPIVVLLATHNGASRLTRVLEGYGKQADAPVPWQLVIVDNASTDNTAEVIESFKRRLPLTSYFEKAPGKNRALNRGLEHIQSDLVILTDDDAIPNSSFIRDWSVTLRKHLGYDIFGAKVTPIFETDRPKWLNSESLPFNILYAENHRAQGEVRFSDIFGPNMAVRGSIFRAGFKFDENIGPNSSDAHYPMGSETEFCRRASMNGSKCFFLDGPEVEHIVRQNQMTWDFVRGRARRIGRSYARLLHRNDDRPTLDIPGLRFLPHNVRQALRWTRKVGTHGRVRARLEWEYYVQVGYYDELRERFS